MQEGGGGPEAGAPEEVVPRCGGAASAEREDRACSLRDTRPVSWPLTAIFMCGEYATESLLEEAEG